MHADVHTHAHTHTHVHTDTHIHTVTYTHTHTRTHTYIHTHVDVYTHTHTHKGVRHITLQTRIVLNIHHQRKNEMPCYLYLQIYDNKEEVFFTNMDRQICYHEGDVEELVWISQEPYTVLYRYIEVILSQT